MLNLLIALIFTAVTTFSVGLLVLVKSWKNKSNRYYAFTSLSVTLWTVFQAISITADSPEASLFFGRLLIAAVWLIPAFQVLSVYYFLNLVSKKWFVKIGFILSIFSSIISFTPYQLAGIKSVGFLKYWYIPGILHPISLLIFLTCSSFVFYEYFKKYRNSTGAKHNQMAYIFWSTLFGYAGGSTTFFYGYDIVVPFVNPFFTYLVGIYPLIVAYAILKHQLLDIKVVVKKGLVYSVIIALISGVITAISFLNSWLVDNIPGFKFWVAPLIIGAVTFFIGRLFWNKSKEVEKLKYEFITIAAHKLRTPLTEIKWAAEALMDKSLKESDRHKFIKGIYRADEHLIELTNELLDVTKTDAMAYNYKLGPVNLEKTMKEVIKKFDTRIKKKNIKVSMHFERDLPKVMADKIRIGLVIERLLENAVFYTKNKIDISMDVYKKNLIFHIEDNGIGIIKEDQEYIFSKFYRGHNAYLTETEGSGVSLYLTKKIIEKHSGKIGARSEGEGKGSIFWFSLPVIN